MNSEVNSGTQLFQFAEALGDFLVGWKLTGFLSALECELEFFQLVAMIGSVGGAEAVDEERAVEVVGFVLEDAGQEVAGFEADFVAVEVVGFDLDCGVARDGGADAGDAETAFFVLFEPAAAAKDGVYVDAFGILGVRLAFGVGDEEPIGQIDLVRGQADALVFIHQLEHLGDHFSQFGVHADERLRAVAKGRMGILDDMEAQRRVRGVEVAGFGRVATR